MKSDFIYNFLDKNWKILTFPMIIAMVIAAAFLIIHYVQTGDFIDKDVELKGGKLITIEVDNVSSISKIESLVPDANIRFVSGLQSSILIEVSNDADHDAIIKKLAENGITGPTSVRSIEPALSDVFWKQAQLGIIVAFILMSITIFIIFRSVAPSSAVIFAAATDIIITAALMNVFGIPLSLASLAALLTLIGYSVDTDVLLTTNVLKEGSEIKHRISSAMKTGLTMTACALAVLIVMILFSGSIVLQQIGYVLFIGLLVDVPATWLTNAGLLRFKLESDRKKEMSKR